MGTQILEREQAEPVLSRLLMRDEAVSLRVTGSSMRPFLQDRRDVVLLRGTAYVCPCPGDVALFSRQGGGLVLHRLLRMLPDGSFQAGGDAQLWTEAVPRERILAVAVAFCRDGGRAQSLQSRRCRRTVWLWQRLRPLRPRLLWLGEKLQKW